MKILSLDVRAKTAVVQAFSPEDLWRLSNLLEAGDVVTARTERKIKVNEDTVARKTLTLAITVEKTELSGDLLRVSGTTVEGLDDIPKGSHHTINIAVHDSLTIQKDWQAWQLEKLKEEDTHPILVLLMDREEAVFAVLRREPEILGTVKGVVQKKGIDGGSPYWEELAKELASYHERIQPRHIIVASPAFFKEYVIKLLPPELAKKTVGATVSATGSAALAELVRRPEVRSVLAQERFSQESILVDQVMEAIHRDLGAWGEKDVAEKVGNGNAILVLVTSALLQRTRQEGGYEAISDILKSAERIKADVHIIETSAGSQLDKLGGIAAVRRW